MGTSPWIAGDTIVGEGGDSIIYDAAAIVLAGGKSRRMKTDKCLLRVNGMPLIASIVMQLKTHFPSVIISSNNPDTYAFLGLPVVVDDPPFGGPPAGILAGLKFSPFRLNFVIACDIPVISWHTVDTLFSVIGDHDVALPSRGNDIWEPFHGMYRRRLIPLLEGAARMKKYWMRPVLDAADVVSVDVDPGEWPEDLNTPEEYRTFIRSGVRSC